MDFQILRCPYCASEGHLEKRGDVWYCAHCGNSCSDNSAKKEFLRLEARLSAQVEGIVDEAMKRHKEEEFYNLRSLLWEKIHAKYLDSEAIVEICRDIKKLEPHDFLANFFEIANSCSSKEVAEAINKIDVIENALYIDLIIDFVIKSLVSEYMMPVSYLIERAYKNTNLEKFEEYITQYEIEAQKVDSGIYSTIIPRDVFIAYSSKDIDKVIELMQLLENNNISCFVALRNLQHGRGAVANYSTALHEAINNSKIIVFVSSKNSRSISCDAISEELTYIKDCDLLGAPHEFRNDYESLPERYKKPRIEYRIDNKPTVAVDVFLREFFADLDYCESAEKVLTRVSEYKLKLKSSVSFDDNDISHTIKTKVEDLSLTQIGQSITSNIAPLIKRIFMFLEDGEFESAVDYCERVLDAEPENANAYLGKLMADLKVKRIEDLEICSDPFDGNSNYTKILRYGDNELISKLKRFVESIKDRNLTSAYNNALNHFDNANSIRDYLDAKKLFSNLGDYQDALTYISRCDTAISEIEQKNEAERQASLTQKATELIRNAMTANDYRRVLGEYKSFSNWNDSERFIKICQRRIQELEQEEKERALANDYSKAVQTMKSAADSRAFRSVSNLFKALIGYRDSEELYKQCLERAKVLQKEETELAQRKKKAEHQRKVRKIIIIVSSIILAIIAITLTIIISVSVTRKNNDYLKFDENLFNDYSVVGYYKKISENVIVPDEHRGKNVSRIGTNAFSNCTNLKTIVLSDGVKSIYSGAFSNCINLTSITIPDSLTGVSDRAFYKCDNLKSITLPAKIDTIGHEAFNDIIIFYKGTPGQWAAIDMGDNNTYKIYYYSENTPTRSGNYWHYDGDGIPTIWDKAQTENDSILVTPNDDKTSYCVIDCTKYLSIADIPKQFDNYPITVIEKEAFKDSTGLNSVVIPESITTINDSAFYNCSNLNTIFYKGTEDEWYAITIFDNNSSLIEAKRYYYSENMPTDIGDYWHYNDSGLPEVWNAIHLTEENLIITSLDNMESFCVIGYVGTPTTIIVPSSYNNLPITKIAEDAFSGCSKLTSVTIPDSIIEIGAHAFGSCNSLKSITLPFVGANKNGTSYTNFDYIFESYYSADADGCPKSLKNVIITSSSTIPKKAFAYCSNITSVTLSEDTHTIDSSAFWGCSSLETVTRMGNVKCFGSDAFSGCTKLTNITINKNVEYIGKEAFESCSISTLRIENDSAKIDNDAFSKCYVNEAYIPTSAIKYLAKVSKKITIISGEKIDARAFYGCTNLTSVTIPDSVTSIGSFAFECCTGLTSVTIPDSVTSIGDSAFSGCSNLSSVTIGNSVTSIGSYAFEGCTGLTSVTFVNPDGWWRASSSSATSGTSISGLDDAETAAEYLMTYWYYYWKRT